MPKQKKKAKLVMAEKQGYQERHLRRHELSQAIEVKELHGGALLGTLVNVHEEGLLIVGVDSLRSDHVYQVVLCPPEPLSDEDAITLGVDCLWVKEAEDLSMQWSGCQIIDASDEAREQIAEMIELFGC